MELRDYIWSFIIGGGFCLIAQILIDKTKLTPARILVGYVVAGVILSGVGIYQYIDDFAASGASIPLTGFGNALAKGVREAVDKDGLFGALTGGFTACAAGIASALCFGFITALFAKGRIK